MFNNHHGWGGTRRSGSTGSANVPSRNSNNPDTPRRRFWEERPTDSNAKANTGNDNNGSGLQGVEEALYAQVAVGVLQTADGTVDLKDVPKKAREIKEAMDAGYVSEEDLKTGISELRRRVRRADYEDWLSLEAMREVYAAIWPGGSNPPEDYDDLSESLSKSQLTPARTDATRIKKAIQALDRYRPRN